MSMIKQHYADLIKKSRDLKNLVLYMSDGTLFVSASDQEWKRRKTQEELQKIGIFMQSCGVRPVMLIERSGDLNPLVIVGDEDDGTMFFGADPSTFDLYWARHLINDLEDAIAFSDKKHLISYQREFVTKDGNLRND